MFSPKSSTDLRRPKSAAGPPPPYHDRQGIPPLIVAETMTTRTEVVTTTTTETTTHLFSLPNWRKRNAPSLPSVQQLAINDLAQLSKPPRSPLFDKALPPTPPNESDIEDAPQRLPTLTPSSPFPSMADQGFSQSQITHPSGGKQSTAILAHAALGIGLPHASTSFSNNEANTISFLSSPPSTPSLPLSPSSPSVRRVKSSQRVQPRHVSENHGNNPNEIQLVERRRRGISFGASTLLSIGVPDVKGKGKEEELSPIPSKSSPKPLARKSSFWSRKKSTHVAEPSHVPATPQEENVLTLPPLPPVHVSPFGIAEFPQAPPADNPDDKPPISPKISGSNSDIAEFSRSSQQTSTIASPRSSLSLFGAESPTIVDGQPLPRLRTQPNSPLLHRLSLGVFSSSETSPAASTRSIHNSQTHNHHNSSSQLVVRPPIPKPLVEEESPEIYLTRLGSAVSKAEVAGILASSSDPFYVQALRTYINQFDFLHIPLDVALRKLLMEVGLPRETQQIDRVMEAFASRYVECNPNYFTSDDHPYILAFSLIMLHTDAFNPSNKHKMTKADYIKNTKLPGIPIEVLDCFFDNIVFAPFIFIEDPVDVNGQLGLTPDVARGLMVNTPTSSSNTPTPFRIGNKVDPYYLITNNFLDPLRVNVNQQIPLENPFTYEGTDGPWDEPELHQAFVNAHVIEIDAPPLSRSTAVFSLSPGGVPSPLLPTFNELSPLAHKRERWNLKITKVGLLNRKDDLIEGGKKAMNRKWKAWSVVLTGSQLLFFRDPSWASTLRAPSDSSLERPSLPSSTVFRPDELFSVKDAIAVYDRSYTKYEHTFRFVLPDGRHVLLQATDNGDLNEWISRINYASTFKTAGVRMRPPGLSGEDVLLTGVAAATSHLHDIQEQQQKLPRPHSWGSDAPNDLMDMLSSNPAKGSLRRRVTLTSGRPDFEVDVPVAPEVEGAEQFKATFDQVKADLAASSEGSWISLDDNSICESPPASPRSFNSNTSRLPSRSQIILTKIHDLDSKIVAVRSHLDADERCVRNIAILTPFQKSTRARLSSAIQGMSRRVMQLRLDVEKLKCHRIVLRSDLASEGRSWSQSKRVALRAAKDTLESRRTQTIPTMTLSLLEDRNKSSSSQDFSQILKTPLSPRPPSSTGDSFHSAIDTGFDWPSSEDMTFLTASPIPTSPRPDRSATVPAFPFPSIETSRSPYTRQKSLSPSSSSYGLGFGQSEHSHNERKSTSDDTSQDEEQEQAEEWNKTRCAKRVSLIHVPSDIGIKSRLKGVAEGISD